MQQSMFNGIISYFSPGASAGAPGESVPAEAGDVARAGRPGKPWPAF